VTAAVAGRAAAVRGGATQAEKDVLARKVAAAQRKPAAATPAAQPAVPAVAPRGRPEPTRPQRTAPGAPRPSRGRFRAGLTAVSPVQTGAGFLLGLLAWGWIGMPLITGGPTRVRDVWRAKFLNKGPDGEWLP